MLDAEAVRRALPMAFAIDALQRGFADVDPSGGPARIQLPTPQGGLMLMPAWDDAGVGVKLVTVTPGNEARGLPFVAAIYLLFDPQTQRPVAVLDGSALTAIRTAAVSGLATRFLARDDAHRLVIVGAGVQGRAHAASMRVVRPVDDVVVISRTRASAAALADDLRGDGVRARVGSAADLADADLICTCTTSTTPLVQGDMLAEGVHVNAVGAYTPQMRELDTAAIARSRLVVETRPAAMEEAGDLLIPIAEGAVRATQVVADLHEVVNGARVRRDARDVTVFKSVGIAFEDLVLATAAVAAA
jgi:ornithine cyclodeaminase/alanine dehydrogenase-like protein (mu-crystallin family)